MPKFSFVIPVFNVERYLDDCITSIINQTYKDFEIILVDDGSTDSCPSKCEEYKLKESRIKVIHQSNAGVAIARNVGISLASGDYLICIDSDDYLADNNVLHKINNKTGDNVDVILYGYQKYYESDASFGEKVVPVLPNKCNAYTMLTQVLHDNAYCGTAWTKAVRLSLIKDYKILFRPGMISEDIDWYLNLLCHAKTFDSINDYAIVYRQRSGSISHSARLKSLTDNIWILEHWPAQFKWQLDDLKMIKVLNSVLAYYYANTLILFSGYPVRVSRQYRERLKAQSSLLDWAITPRALMIRKFYRIFGFDFTTFVLKILSKLKKRQ